MSFFEQTWTFDENQQPRPGGFAAGDVTDLPYLVVTVGGYERIHVAGNGKGSSRKIARLIGAAPTLLAKLKEAVQNCPCTLRERDSGHRVGCFAPGALDAIRRAEERQENAS